MLFHKTSNAIQFMSWKAPVLCHYDWVKPKLGDSALSLYMDVRRLAFVRTEK
jgi:hypothetical protein